MRWGRLWKGQVWRGRSEFPVLHILSFKCLLDVQIEMKKRQRNICNWRDPGWKYMFEKKHEYSSKALNLDEVSQRVNINSKMKRFGD